MYSVSNDYLAAIHNAVQSGHISGLIGAVAFTASDVLLGSASISNQCADSTDVKLGAVYIGTLKITFANRNLVPRGSWEGKTITVYWNQLIDDESEPKVYETIPCGKFIIAEANHAAEGVVITAYDNMSRFDKELQFTTTSGSPYNLAKSFCQTCNVGLGMTKAQIEALPNGTETLSLYPDNDCKTYRDVISWLAMTLGSFATINRSGDLVFRTYDNTPLISFSASERIAGGNFSDFKSYFTQITVQDLAEGTSYTEKMPDNTGLSMDLGSNPFMQYGLTATKRDIRLAILGSLTGLKYTPFTTSLLGNPAFDLGDCIEFTGGIAGTSVKCCVMSYTYTFNRVFNVSGFGKNPATFGAQSKTDKAVTQNSKSSASNEFQFIKYTNADPFEINQGFKDTVGTIPANPVKELLAELTISTIKETDVEIDFKMSTWDFKPTISEQSSAFFYFIASFWGVVYELDGEEIGKTLDTSMSPVMATNIRSNTYWIELFSNLAGTQKRVQMTFQDHKTILKVPANSTKVLKVYGYFVDSFSRYDLTIPAPSTITNGHYKFDTGSVEIVVKGQGLAKEERWNGLVILSDVIGLHTIAGYGFDNLTESAVATIIDNLVTQCTDQMDEEQFNALIPETISEALSIYLTAITFNLVTEGGEYNIVTEDEGYNLVTET